LIKVKFELKETVSTIIAEERFIDIAKASIIHNRSELESYIRKNPFFRLTFEPYSPEKGRIPDIVKRMIDAGERFNVGPMAAVAGAIAEMAIEAMVDKGATHTIVDNGGDIAMMNDRTVLVGIYTGGSNNFALKIEPRHKMLAVCTSSGVIGHSISFGEADAVTVISESASLADVAATAICNIVGEGSPKGNGDVSKMHRSLEDVIDGMNMERIEGVLVFYEDYVGRWGKTPKIVNVV
jgi:hypothetical protein